jgi:hypothetical protein
MLLDSSTVIASPFFAAGSRGWTCYPKNRHLKKLTAQSRGVTIKSLEIDALLNPHGFL